MTTRQNSPNDYQDPKRQRTDDNKWVTNNAFQYSDSEKKLALGISEVIIKHGYTFSQSKSCAHSVIAHIQEICHSTEMKSWEEYSINRRETQANTAYDMGFLPPDVYRDIELAVDNTEITFGLEESLNKTGPGSEADKEEEEEEEEEENEEEEEEDEEFISESDFHKAIIGYFTQDISKIPSSVMYRDYLNSGEKSVISFIMNHVMNCILATSSA